MVKEGILPDLWMAGFTRTLEVHDPVASSATEDGKEKKRRVEVWLRK